MLINNTDLLPPNITENKIKINDKVWMYFEKPELKIEPLRAAGRKIHITADILFEDIWALSSIPLNQVINTEHAIIELIDAHIKKVSLPDLDENNITYKGK